MNILGQERIHDRAIQNTFLLAEGKTDPDEGARSQTIEQVLLLQGLDAEDVADIYHLAEIATKFDPCNSSLAELEASMRSMRANKQRGSEMPIKVDQSFELTNELISCLEPTQMLLQTVLEGATERIDEQRAAQNAEDEAARREAEDEEAARMRQERKTLRERRTARIRRKMEDLALQRQ